MNSEFLNAIQSGDRKKVESLLLANPTLIHEKENGVSPILLATYHDEPAIAEFLAERMGTLTVFEAAATGRTGTLVKLLAREPEMISAYSEDGFQPLGLAAFFGRYDTVEFLVKAGAPLNAYSTNPLHAAPLQSAVAGNHLEIAKLLLSNGADPNCRDSSGYTPLHAAAQNGDMDMINALLYGGADLEARGDDGKLPVDLALDAEHEEAARLLMEGITRRNRTRRPATPQT